MTDKHKERPKEMKWKSSVDARVKLIYRILDNTDSGSALDWCESRGLDLENLTDLDIEKVIEVYDICGWNEKVTY